MHLSQHQSGNCKRKHGRDDEFFGRHSRILNLDG
jgi:hypothetical protein